LTDERTGEIISFFRGLSSSTLFCGAQPGWRRLGRADRGWQNRAASRFGNDAACSRLLQIPARLTPSIFVDDIGERYTANWPEPAHGIPDRQQGIGVDVRRQLECGLRFLLELQIQRRQCRAEAERSRREQHILHRRIDRRPGRAGRCAAFQARHDPNRGLMDVCGQIFRASSSRRNRSGSC
jgi:hypothetical protein